MDRLPLWRWFLNWTGIDRGGPRRWIVLAVAAALVLLGQWLKATLSLASLEQFAWGMVADFSRIQPFSFVPEFFHRLAGCSGRSGCD